MTCHNCGADNPPTYKFCQNCGEEFALIAAPANPPPLTTFPGSRREGNKSLLFPAIGAVALVCMCLCGLLFAGSYIAGDPNSVFEQSSARPSPTRRVTSTPADDTQDTSSSTSSTPNALAPALPPSPNIGDATTSAAATFDKWKAAQVESAFRNARLEIATPRTMTSDDYGAVPRVAKEGVRFFIPSLGGQKGGRIYTFSTAKDLQTVQQYYASQSGTPPWIFVKDNILVQIHSDLPENRANQYKNALNTFR